MRTTVQRNSIPAPSVLVIGGPQWSSVPSDTATDDNAVAFRALRDSAKLTNAQLTVL